MLLLIACLFSLVKSDPNNFPPIPQLARYANFENGFSPEGSLVLYWNVVNQGSSNELIDATLVFNATNWFAAQPNPPKNNSALNAWFAIGWGSNAMLTSEVLISWANPNGNVKSIEGVPAQSYAPPVASSNKIITLQGLSQVVVDNSIFVQFQRPTRAPGHAQIDVNVPSQHIWAFNARPNPGSQSGWKDYHGANRGAYLINYSNSAGNGPIATPDITTKRVHGGMMALVWLLIFPASIYITRFFRSVSGWVKIHVSFQIIGSVFGVLPSAILIIASIPANLGLNVNLALIPRPHSVLGLTIVSLTFVQGTLGYLNRLNLVSEKRNIDRSRFNIVTYGHRYLGRILVLAAFVQIGLGIQILFPWEETKFRGIEVWMLYIALVLFWFLLYTLTELYVVFKMSNPGKKLNDSVEKMPLMAADIKEASLESYSWENIDASVLGGDLLVVANGRYVYRINDWINSHPGGRVILYSVAGTDITNDYFFESGFDAEVFVPAVVRQARSGKGLISFDTSVTDAGSQVVPGTIQATADEFSNMSALSEEQWQHVMRARRTHVHSKSALAKLSTLIVGELSLSEQKSMVTLDGSKAVSFDPCEYRRCALVENVLVSTGQSKSPIYRLKFCLLYPFDARSGAPGQFLPGQCVEIQSRVNGKYVSRYFTPTSGSPNAFEIFVKLTPQGEMTPFLTKQRPGDRQFKVRGPFASNILNSPVSYLADGPRRILFISGGSGLSPVIQLINHYLLPTFEPAIALYAYAPHSIDELSINPGDYIMARYHYFDGWAEGVNLTTNQQGLFPWGLTQPRLGPASKMVVVNATNSVFDVFGHDQLKGALLSFPDTFSITHCCSTGIPLGLPREMVGECAPGKVVEARVDARVLAEALTRVCDGSNLPPYVILCGPNTLQSLVYDVLTTEMNVPHEVIRMMKVDHF